MKASALAPPEVEKKRVDFDVMYDFRAGGKDGAVIKQGFLDHSAKRRPVRILFWLSLIGILYTYLGYPALIWMLARLRPLPWTSAPVSFPSVSIVLAVHNGAALLPRKIEHLLGLDYPHIKEIIIVSDGSTDGTAELLAGWQRKTPRLTTIILTEHGGKAVAVNGQAVNEGIDSHLEACYCPDRGDQYDGGQRKARKLVLCHTLECSVSVESLPVLLRRLSDLKDEAGPRLASDILTVLGFNEYGKFVGREALGLA